MQVGSFAHIAISLALLVSTAHAAPKYKHTASTSSDPSIVAAERMWSAAAAETDPARIRARWLDAADAFLSIVEAARVTKVEQAAAATAGLLALKNMLDVAPRVRVERDDKDIDHTAKPEPRPMPDDDKRVVRLLLIYLRFDSTSDEAVSVKFLLANIHRRFDHFDVAVPVFHEILDKHRGHETAEYAANLLLDSYNRLQRYDDMLALVDKLRADRAWLADKPDLANTLRSIRIQSVRVRTGVNQAAPDREAFERCAAAYSALADEAPRDPGGDELLYNAAVCYEQARSLADARAAIGKLDVRFPRSRLRHRALVRLAALEATVGRFAEAAHVAERALAIDPQGHHMLDLALEAIRWRLLLGEVDRAERVLATITKAQPQRTEQIAGAKLAIIASLVAARRRADAARLAQTLEATRWDRASVSPLFAARLLVDVACPRAPVDDLCLVPRNLDITRIAMAAVRAVGAGEADVAASIALDIELEDLLRGRRSARRDHLRERYRSLAASTRGDVRAAARARLAAIARHDKRLDDARAELAACVAEDADGWREICKRMQVELEVPAPRDRERLPPPAVRIAADALESPWLAMPVDLQSGLRGSRD